MKRITYFFLILFFLPRISFGQEKCLNHLVSKQNNVELLNRTHSNNFAKQSSTNIITLDFSTNAQNDKFFYIFVAVNNFITYISSQLQESSFLQYAIRNTQYAIRNTQYA